MNTKNNTRSRKCDTVYKNTKNIQRFINSENSEVLSVFGNVNLVYMTISKNYRGCGTAALNGGADLKWLTQRKTERCFIWRERFEKLPYHKYVGYILSLIHI